MRDEPVSALEQSFVLQCVRGTPGAAPLRADGRALTDARRVSVQFYASSPGTVQVQYGAATLVHASCACRVRAPYPERPSEGVLRVAHRVSRGASERHALQARTDDGDEVSVASAPAISLEQVLRETRCVDVESLCLLAGRRVFEITVTVTVLDYDGNAFDAALTAAVCALMHFRRPDFTVQQAGGSESVAHAPSSVRVYHPSERAPVPLSVTTVPLAVTFALFWDDGSAAALDPLLAEEYACHGALTLIMNQYGDLLTMRKDGGAAAVSLDVLDTCAMHASKRAQQVAAMIRRELAAVEGGTAGDGGERATGSNVHALARVRPVKVDLPDANAGVPAGADGDGSGDDADDNDGDGHDHANGEGDENERQAGERERARDNSDTDDADGEQGHSASGGREYATATPTSASPRARHYEDAAPPPPPPAHEVTAAQRRQQEGQDVAASAPDSKYAISSSSSSSDDDGDDDDDDGDDDDDDIDDLSEAVLPRGGGTAARDKQQRTSAQRRRQR